MSVEKPKQKSVKITPKIYDDLEMLKQMLTEFYQKRFSSDEALSWLFIMAHDSVNKINDEASGQRVSDSPNR